MSRLLLKASVRFFRQHPWQFWLMLLSIALGTAVIVAVDLANHSASRSFELSVAELSGTDTHEITASDGWVPEAFYVELRAKERLRTAYPVVKVQLVVDGLAVEVIGTDPLAAPRGLAGALGPDQWNQLLGSGDSVVLSERALALLDSDTTDAVVLTVGGEKHRLLVASVLNGAQPQWDQTLFVDISVALKLAGRYSGLDAIRLQLNDAQTEELMTSLPAGLKLTSLQRRRHSFNAMTEAFTTNLSAMSLLAMLVGAFLVYNTMTFSVLQRRQSFAVGRMLGVTGGQLFWQLMFEAMVLGLVGSTLGVLLGILLGQGLLGLVTQTINDLYAEVSANGLILDWASIVKAILLTLLAVFLATLIPAWEAARVEPVAVHRRSTLERRQSRWSGRLALLGLFIGFMSWLLIQSSGANLVLGFAALFLFILGYSLVIPWLLDWVLRYASKIFVEGRLLGRMALREIRASLSRTGLAVIALSVAVSATMGVSIMIGSFRISVSDWLDTTLQNDLYVSAVSHDESRPAGNLPLHWLKAVPELEGVESFSTGRSLRMEVNGIDLPVLVLQPGPTSGDGFEFLESDSPAIWQDFKAGRGIIVSEPLSFHQGIQVSDVIMLQADEGLEPFKVLGVFQDYGSSQGKFVVSRSLFDRHWDNPSVSTIGLKVKENELSTVKTQLLTLAPSAGESGVVVRADSEIKAHSMEVFDRTFAITHVLRLLVIVVAFVGVFSALMAVFLEKTREFAILRATGFTPGQLVKLVLMQSWILGLLAGVLALPLGWLMSQILIEVINRRSFGWTMAVHVEWSTLINAVLLAIVAAVIAAAIPARRISRMKVREGMMQ